MLMGIRVTVDGDVAGVVVDTGVSRLHGIQTAIGAARVDVVGLPEGVDMWIDDDGYGETRSLSPDQHRRVTGAALLAQGAVTHGVLTVH